MLQTRPSHMADPGHVSSLLPETACAIPAALDRSAAQLQIRDLNRHDLTQIERHLLTLDSMSRRSRFGSAFADTAVVAYVRRIDLRRALLVGAVNESDGCIVGLAEAQPTTSPLRVEMAVSVHMPYRRKGLGFYLATLAMNQAFSRGAEVANFHFARDNRATIGLIRALGARFTGLDRAEIRSSNPARLRDVA